MTWVKNSPDPHPINFRPNQQDQAIIDAILAAHPEMAGNKCAAIRLALYSLRNDKRRK